MNRLENVIFEEMKKAMQGVKGNEFDYAYALGDNLNFKVRIYQGYEKVYILTANVEKVEQCKGYRSVKTVPAFGYSVRVSDKVRKSNKALLMAIDNVLYNENTVKIGFLKSLVKNDINTEE